MSNSTSITIHPPFVPPSLDIIETCCAYVYKINQQTQVEIWCDTLGQLKGVWKNGLVKVDIQPIDIEGIPIEVRMNQKNLEKFLTNTYVKLICRLDNSLALRVFPRMRGGGNSFSSFGQHSQHAQQPPPPTRTPISYTAGFPIRKIECPDVPGGRFIEHQGGVNENRWSVVFESQNASLRPLVKVFVWRKDYYAKEISQLVVLRDRTIADLTHIQGEMGKTTRSVKELSARILNLQQQSGVIQKDLESLNARLELTHTNLVKKMSELDEVQRCLVEDAPSVRSLIDFLAISSQMGLVIEHPAVTGFRAHLPEVDLLIGKERAEGNLLTTILSKWNEIVLASNAAQDKEIVAVVGCTGTGKSTLVNHLLGCQMKRVGKLIEVVNPEQEIAKIGHKLATSETILAQVCTTQQTSLIFADCGGFLDTRNEVFDVIISSSVKITLSAAKSVKLIMCINTQNLTNGRAQGFTADLKLILQGLFKKLKFNEMPVVILLTRPHMQEDMKMYSTQDALDDLDAIAQEVTGTPEEELYQFVLRENGKYVHVYDPLSEESRRAVEELLTGMTAIKNPREVIDAPCTTQSMRQLLDVVISISETTVKKYEKYKHIRKEREDLQALELELTTCRQQLTERYTAMSSSIMKDVEAKTRLDQQIRDLEVQEAQKRGDRDRALHKIKERDKKDFVIFESKGKEFAITSGLVTK